MIDKWCRHCALVESNALLIEREVEAKFECGDLSVVVPQSRGETAAVRERREIGVVDELLGPGECEARRVGVAVDVVELDPLEPDATALRHAPP